jgi:hypothetical protein
MTIDLKGKKIFVTTNTEMGWDCVTGVYLASSEKALIEYLGDQYDDSIDVISSPGLQVVKTKSEIRDEKIDKIIKP